MGKQNALEHSPPEILPPPPLFFFSSLNHTLRLLQHVSCKIMYRMMTCDAQAKLVRGNPKAKCSHGFTMPHFWYLASSWGNLNDHQMCFYFSAVPCVLIMAHCSTFRDRYWSLLLRVWWGGRVWGVSVVITDVGKLFTTGRRARNSHLYFSFYLKCDPMCGIVWGILLC
jgi:hypothetical protein